MYQNAHRAALVRDTLETTEFRLATIDDVPELAQLFATFFAEARYQDRGIVYDLERAKRWLERVIFSGSCPHLVAVVDTKIVGSVSYDLDQTFCVEPVAVLHTIYVLPEYRRSAIGRVLAALVCEAASADGAIAFHAPLASGMIETSTLKNLFVHAGFEPIGVIMGRRL